MSGFVAAANRQCNDCELCCELMAVENFTEERCKCPHQTGNGCEIYDQARRPWECGEFRCLYLENIVPEELRPELTRVVFVRHFHWEMGWFVRAIEETPGCATEEGSDILKFVMALATKTPVVIVCPGHEGQKLMTADHELYEKMTFLLQASKESDGVTRQIPTD